MQQIQNNVYWINTGASNCYLCYEDSGISLIDTGMPSGASKIIEGLAEIGCTLADITQILLTHADIDHVRGLAVCLAKSDAAVFAGAASAAFLASGKSPRHLPKLMQFMSDVFVRYEPVPADSITIVKEGDVIPALGGLEVLATPGHTMDHLSFYSASSDILFAGDILSTREGMLQRTTPFITADDNAANQSALRLAAMAPTVYACGHGTPLHDPNGEEATRFSETIRHYMMEEKA